MFDWSKFRENLKSLVENSPYTTREIATAVGVTPSSMSMYITGKRDPDAEYIIAMAKYFGVSIDWLLGVDDTPERHQNTEILNLIDRYNVASPSDRLVIQTLLQKYRA